MSTKAYELGKVRGYETQMPHATASEWDNYYRKLVPFVPGVTDFAADMADYDRGMADGYAAFKAEHPFQILALGSHPDDGNDDCAYGLDFKTLDEARKAFLANHERSVAYVALEGPGVSELRKNPAFAPPRTRRTDDDWRREIAMQAGMDLGVEAYNDAMGYESNTQEGDAR